jgi:hypothetical protein
MRHVNMIKYAFLYKVIYSILLRARCSLNKVLKKKTLFKRQTGCFDGQVIRNGYTHKDTTDRLQENDITSDQSNIPHQIRATYHFRSEQHITSDKSKSENYTNINYQPKNHSHTTKTNIKILKNHKGIRYQPTMEEKQESNALKNQ